MSRLQNAVLPLLLVFIVAILPALPGHFWDTMAWMDWSKHIFFNGLRNTYDYETDYLPVYHYILWIYGKIAASGQSIDDNIYYLRLFTLFFDLAGLWYVYKWIDKKISYYLITLLCILNIAYSYNTLIWGQVDGILSALVFISLYYAHKGQQAFSAVFFLIALNFKLQAIVFLPIWGLLLLKNIVSKPTLKNILLPLAGIVVVELLILWPFIILKKDGWQQVYSIITKAVNTFPTVGMGSKNIWNWFLNGDTREVSDAGIWLLGITYKQGGLVMFFTCSFLVLLPVFIKVFKTNETGKITQVQLWLTCALISMLFYYFNTQMHERYVHPAFIFIVAYSFYTNQFFPFILLSIAYFLNLEDEMHAMKLNNYNILLFNDRFISILYAVNIIYLITRLVSSYRLNKVQLDETKQ